MKLSAIIPLVAVSLVSAAPIEKRISGVRGFDISHYQGTVDFKSAFSSGARFVIIKVGRVLNPSPLHPTASVPIHFLDLAPANLHFYPGYRRYYLYRPGLLISLRWGN